MSNILEATVGFHLILSPGEVFNFTRVKVNDIHRSSFFGMLFLYTTASVKSVIVSEWVVLVCSEIPQAERRKQQ